MELTKDENASSPEESLEQVGLRLKHWRETRVRGARIPEELWTAVAGLARQVGVQRVAKVLHLDYVRLKKRVQGTGREPRCSRVGNGRVDAGFVEMVVSAPSPVPVRCECAVELENAHGAKMRMELSGNGLGAVDVLCRSFWNAR